MSNLLLQFKFSPGKYIFKEMFDTMCGFIAGEGQNPSGTVL